MAASILPRIRRSSPAYTTPCARLSISWRERVILTSEIIDTRLLRALRLEPVDRTPIWFMRQAGRALPEYRAIRERYDLLEICRRPELCAEVTMQPVRRLGVDAAILFADITTPLAGLGVDVEIVEGVGPVIERPI